MKKQFNIYNGDLSIKINVTENQKDAIIYEILSYCERNNCISGESLFQNDNCLIEAPEVLSNIIDDILNLKKEWI